MSGLTTFINKGLNPFLKTVTLLLSILMLNMTFGVQAVAESRSTNTSPVNVGLPWWVWPGSDLLNGGGNGSGDLNPLLSGEFENKAGKRGYKLFLPKNIVAQKTPLIVILHGCFQSGDNMANGTEIMPIAEKMGFAVLFPEQTYGDNVWKCWNWFKPENLQRGTGEASIIAGMTLDVVKKNKLNAGKVFVSGLSAGGAMSANLLACYSDVFKGAMVHSGLMYDAARTEDEAHEVTKNGSTRSPQEGAMNAYKCSPKRNSPVQLLVVHGTKDNFVNPLNVEQIFQEFSILNDLNDDGQINNSFESVKTETVVKAEYGNYGAHVATYANNGNNWAQVVWIDEMAHGWSGGQPVAPYMESRGIKAINPMLNLFLGANLPLNDWPKKK